MFETVLIAMGTVLVIFFLLAFVATQRCKCKWGHRWADVGKSFQKEEMRYDVCLEIPQPKTVTYQRRRCLDCGEYRDFEL